MKNLFLVLAVLFIASACATDLRVAGGANRDPDTYLIQLYGAQDGDDCLKKTKTKDRNCNRHKDDESCNVPSDQLVWVWKKPKDAQPFQIVAKIGNTSPFDPDAACTGAGSVVICRIKDEPDDWDFYYDIVVNPGTARECTYDPRILIN